MSKPRQIVPGRYWLVTRRCVQRQFLLRPDPETNNAFIYCLGLAAARSGVQVVATLAMSNHYHAVLYDPNGTLPDFTHEFNTLLARSQNALRVRWENFWAAEAASAVHLVTPEDVMAKILYTLMNPVTAGLVDRVHQWPGVSSWGAMLRNEAMRATRPRHFFRKTMPAKVAVPLAVPAGHADRDAYVSAVRTLVAQAEAEAADVRLREGRRVLGRKAVLAQSVTARPQTAEPRRELSPRVACRSKWHRIEALKRCRAFQEAYAAARARWLQGEAPAFPPGTWAMRHLVAPPPPVRPLHAA